MLGQIIPIIDIYKVNKSLRKKNCEISNNEISENLERIDIKHLEDDYKAAIETKIGLKTRLKQ